MQTQSFNDFYESIMTPEQKIKKLQEENVRLRKENKELKIRK